MELFIYIIVGSCAAFALLYVRKSGYNEGYRDGSKDSLQNIIKFSETMMNIGKPSENAMNTQRVASQE